MDRTDTITKLSFIVKTHRVDCEFCRGGKKGTMYLDFTEREDVSTGSEKWDFKKEIPVVLTYEQALYLAERIVEAVNNCKKEEALCANCE